jgi:hypothetical protein
MQGRYLLAAVVPIACAGSAIWTLDLSAWWMMLGLWLACIPLFIGLVSEKGPDGTSDRRGS